jgi:1-pyrroline-5-carboxylate dehydrogenase
MPFDNEHTFLKFMIAKKEELFHNQYEQAILDVKSEFGRKYPLIIGGKKIKMESTFSHISPVDTRKVV